MFKAFWIFSAKLPENDRFPTYGKFSSGTVPFLEFPTFLSCFQALCLGHKKKKTKMQKQIVFSKVNLKRKKEKAAKQLSINSTDNNGDGEIIVDIG